MNSGYLHIDLLAAVIRDSVSDAMIGQKEEASDSNPWENVDHNDRLCLGTTAAAPSLHQSTGGEIESDFLFGDFEKRPWGPDSHFGIEMEKSRKEKHPQ